MGEAQVLTGLGGSPKAKPGGQTLNVLWETEAFGSLVQMERRTGPGA